MENGEPTYLAGKSGIEIVREIIFETMRKEITDEPEEHFGRSKEYWVGWAVPIINGVRQENTVKFSKFFHLRIFSKCTIRFMRQMFPSLRIL